MFDVSVLSQRKTAVVELLAGFAINSDNNAFTNHSHGHSQGPSDDQMYNTLYA